MVNGSSPTLCSANVVSGSFVDTCLAGRYRQSTKNIKLVTVVPGRANRFCRRPVSLPLVLVNDDSAQMHADVRHVCPTDHYRVESRQNSYYPR